MSLRAAGALLVLAHGAIGEWHLIVAAKAAPTAGPASLALPLTIIGIVHVIFAIVAWMAAPRASGWVLTVFFAAVLVFELYEHFLGAVPTNIFHLAPGEWAAQFRVSVYLLLASEMLGLWTGTRLLAGSSRNVAIRAR